MCLQEDQVSATEVASVASVASTFPDTVEVESIAPTLDDNIDLQELREALEGPTVGSDYSPSLAPDDAGEQIPRLRQHDGEEARNSLSIIFVEAVALLSSCACLLTSGPAAGCSNGRSAR